MRLTTIIVSANAHAGRSRLAEGTRVSAVVIAVAGCLRLRWMSNPVQ